MSLSTLESIFDDLHTTIDGNLVENRLVGLKIRVRRRDLAASHTSPRGEPTTWSSPKRYPSVSGRIWMRFDLEAQGLWVTDIFNRSDYHLGSGGGGDYESPWSAVYKIYYHRFGDTAHHTTLRGSRLLRPVLYGFTFCFWLDDFPQYRKAEEQRAMLRTIAGETEQKDTELEWTDCVTLGIDDDFNGEPESGIAHRQIYNQSTQGR